MHTVFSQMTSQVRSQPARKLVGRVKAITGMSLKFTGLESEISLGDRCLVKGKRGEVLAEVTGVSADGTILLPFGSWDGVSVGDMVRVHTAGDVVYPDNSWIGRTVNALGKPLDDQGPLHEGGRARYFKDEPLNSFSRKRVGHKLETQIKTMDVFTPICRGQRMGIFAGSGVGKSSMMSMLARNTDADVIVIGLVGERGREVQDFIQEDLGEEGMKRSVLVVATGDEPPLMRRQAAWTAMTVAEHFRDQGLQVMLLMDSVTRFAMAQREIGLSGGEPPTSKGYPPTVFAELPRLLERAGPGTKNMGDITGIFTVLVDGDDHNEPISDTVRGITDGHIVLDRTIAENGRYPAIDILKSVSRMLPDCHTDAEYVIMKEAKQLFAKYDAMAELIRIGAYKTGTDAETDSAIAFAKQAEKFLSQRKQEHMPSIESFGHLYKMLVDSGVQIALPAEEAAGEQ
ncbi:flagellar protein export ATPase FliI [Sulfitobacter sp. R18_1]|uniref:flagellar protein export ATPase FliI n=1 Tax=Sulfitobacter sp. R18_1 TaxID=2821104 RepID=UPI001ADB64E8|nr:flagellar protein export ATPase FliI [Sulfitobacter sp. R18_1]MBO9428606.1 flagellar protein export ATPase FliI [Sulfitobacter sp. R18_1]